MPYYNVDLTATARLPGLDIEVIHRRSPSGGREEISINLQAVPSFEAFHRFLEATNQADLARSRARTDAALKHRANSLKERL